MTKKIKQILDRHFADSFRKGDVSWLEDVKKYNKVAWEGDTVNLKGFVRGYWSIDAGMNVIYSGKKFWYWFPKKKANNLFEYDNESLVEDLISTAIERQKNLVLKTQLVDPLSSIFNFRNNVFDSWIASRNNVELQLSSDHGPHGVGYTAYINLMFKSYKVFRERTYRYSSKDIKEFKKHVTNMVKNMFIIQKFFQKNTIDPKLLLDINQKYLVSYLNNIGQGPIADAIKIIEKYTK